MPDNFNDDLFQHTSMTFGEHLDELRVSLFKAVLAMAVGFIIGLCFGEYVVNWIKTPVENALEDYYTDSAVTKFQQRIAERVKNGESVPEFLKDEKKAREIVVKGQMLADDYYVLPEDLAHALHQVDPETYHDLPDTVHDPETLITREGMIRISLWHTLQDDSRVKVRALNVQEGFTIYVKAAFMSGAILASPFVFYFLWSFVAAGLYPHERRYVQFFLPFSLGLFLFGAALAFFFVFPPVLGFFFTFNRRMGIEPDPRVSEWLSFVLLMPLGFGASFQLPLVMLFLERIGIFTVQSYLNKWRIAILIISIAAMILTPSTDPYSMLLMFFPLSFLYFGGIGLCKWLPKQGRPASQELAVRG